MSEHSSPTAAKERGVHVPARGATIQGDLTIPPAVRGIVIFAHGSGSSRHSPRNRHVAQVLVRSGFATLLMDLLTEEEEEAERHTRHLRFDIDLLAGRLEDVTRWLARDEEAAAMPVGYFGASTGAAAALVAAARVPEKVRAVVSRGGPPDLAGPELPRVSAGTLRIVGGNDHGVVELNEGAYAALHCAKEIRVVPGATHLFEEPGTLDEVARLAAEWFTRYL